MRSNTNEQRTKLQTVVKEALQLISMFVIFNYVTLQMDSVSETMANTDFINPETQQKEIFHSINIVHLIQKFTVLLICSVIIHAGKHFLPNTLQTQHNHTNLKQRKSSHDYINSEDQNIKQSSSSLSMYQQFKNKPMAFNLNFYEEVFLGVTTYIAIKMFIVSQFRLNVIYIVIGKYANFLFIIITISFILIRTKKQHNKQLCTKNNWKSISKYLFPSILLGTGIVLIKVIITEIPSFFRSYAGKSPQEPISFQDIFLSILSFLIDFVLYIGVFLIKQKYSKNSELVSEQMRKETLIDKQFQTLKLLSSWTKYTALIFFIETLLNGQFFQFLGFVSRHTNILRYLMEIAVYYFFAQLISCRVLLKYNHYIYFLLMMSSGMFSKAYFYIFKNFNLLSVPYYLLLLGFYLLIKVRISQRNLNEEKGLFGKNQISKIKEYDSLDLEEKNVDCHQQVVELDK